MAVSSRSIRGEHNGLQYRLNGIILPEGISVFSQTLDPRLVDKMQLIMGALPAEYGLRTAGVIDIKTKDGLLDPVANVEFYGGQRGTTQPSCSMVPRLKRGREGDHERT